MCQNTCNQGNQQWGGQQEQEGSRGETKTSDGIFLPPLCSKSNKHIKHKHLQKNVENGEVELKEGVRTHLLRPQWKTSTKGAVGRWPTATSCAGRATTTSVMHKYDYFGFIPRWTKLCVAYSHRALRGYTWNKTKMGVVQGDSGNPTADGNIHTYYGEALNNPLKNENGRQT